MTIAAAKAVMRLAECCLGDSRTEWARAMHGEFHSAIDDGRPLAFATGCLLAAWRQMLAEEEGRFVLANHALALGLLIPTAALQLACAAGFPLLPLGRAAMPAAGSAEQLYLSDAYPSAIPVLLALWLLLGIGHLRLAWLLLERDWPRMVRTAALTVAASATLVMFTAVLFLDDAGTGFQILLLGLELAAIHRSACWHDRLFGNRAASSLAR